MTGYLFVGTRSLGVGCAHIGKFTEKGTGLINVRKNREKE